jgi:citrate lyase beta subunit
MIVVAARANAIDAIDGPYGDFSDPEGYRQECVNSKSLGFVGKWAIHPSQIEIANEVYSPAESEVEDAQRVAEAMEKGAEEGRGAVRLDGEMIDEATVRRARRTLERARTIGMIE